MIFLIGWIIDNDKDLFKQGFLLDFPRFNPCLSKILVVFETGWQPFKNYQEFVETKFINI